MNKNLQQHPWLNMKSDDYLNRISKQLQQFELEEEVFIKWFGNFKSESEYQLALKIFFLIDYRPSTQSINNIKIYETQITQSMYELNKTNKILVSSNDIVDSSTHFIYPLAKQWEIDKLNIFRKSDLNDIIINDKNNFFIFFNDTHGTGNQFATEFKDTIKCIGEDSCAIISITMTDIAKQRFDEEFPNIALIQPNFQSTKNISHHQDEKKLESKDIELLKQLGEKVYSKDILGYKDTGLLVAYSHQCPNNTLPIIWANGTNNDIGEKEGYPWNPLFEYRRIKKKSAPKIEQKSEDKSLTIEPPKNPDFIGRVDELKKIKENLEKNNLIYIVNGIGGVGKSELSYEYFHQFKDEYKNIAFLELSSEKLSLEDIFMIEFKEKFQVNSFKAIIKRLQEYPQRNLFLIDNLEKREDFEKLKVLNVNFDLLITSRLTDIDTKHQLNLETLLKDDARDLFLSIYDTKEDIEDILDYLDNHPLFINLIAKSLLRNYISFDELKDDIKNNTIAQIKSTNSQTFQEHLEKLFNKQFHEDNNKELKILLQKLSIFPSVEIDFEVYDKLLKVKKINLQMLVDKGWLIQKENQYKLHQIIKTFISASYEPEYEDIINIFDNLAKYIDPNDSILIENSFNHYIPIIESFLTLYENKQDKYIVRLLDSLIYLYHSLDSYDKNSANFEKALKWYKKSLVINEKVLGINHSDTDAAYNNSVSEDNLKRKYEESLKWYKKSLVITEKVLGKNHPDTASTYNNIASVYDSKGKYEEALKWYEKALEIKEKVLDKNHPDIAVIYNNIASVYNLKGKYEESLKWYKKALEIKEKVLGKNHLDTAVTYNNIAYIYKIQKFCNKANEFFDKALDIYKQTDYSQNDIFRINQLKKEIKKLQKQEKKAKFKDKGRFCKEYKVFETK